MQAEINWAEWAPPFPEDALILFRPDGRVQSNRPWSQERLRLLVSNGFSLSGPGLSQLDGVDALHQVTISRWGEVQLTQAPSQLQHQGLSFGSELLAQLPSLSPSSNQSPTIVGDVRFTPAPQPTLDVVAPAGSHAVIPPDGLLTVEIRATDNDGDSLSCLWSVAPGSGSFSAPVRHRMRWLPSEQLWLGRWSWQPPPQAQPGQTFQLNCQVEDQKGATTAAITLGGATIIPRVAISKPGRLVYESGPEIWICNWDGTDSRCLVRGKDIGNPVQAGSQCWSPDGRKVAFKADGTLWCVNADGTDLHLMATYSGGIGSTNLEWSHRGDSLYVLKNMGAEMQVLRLPASARGSAPISEVVCSSPITPGDQYCGLSLHPNGQLFSTFSWTSSGPTTCFLWKGQTTGDFHPSQWLELDFAADGRATYTRDGQVYLTSSSVQADATTRTVTFPAESPPLLYHHDANTARLSPDGQWVYFQDIVGGNYNMFLARANGSDKRQLVLPTGSGDNAHWSNR